MQRGGECTIIQEARHFHPYPPTLERKTFLEAWRTSIFRLTYTSFIPYFVLMPVFMLAAGMIQRQVPFFRRALAQEKSDRTHNMQLDGMRGVLALSVFFTHSLVFHFWSGDVHWGPPPSNFYSQLGIIAVGLFFLTTGFLFWTKAQKGTLGRLDLYFGHRIRRLVPAYVFSLVLIFAVVLVETRFRLEVPLPHLLRSLAGYFSFGLLATPALNGFGEAPWINAGITWSLTIEWMFYLALPIMAIAARGRLRQLLLAITSISLYHALPLFQRHFTFPGMGTLMYFNEYLFRYFLVGMLVSFLKLRYRTIPFLQGPAAALMGMLTLAYLMFFRAPNPSFVEGLALGVPMLLVVYGNSFFGLLRHRSMVFLGQISYSIYLLHAIVLFIARDVLRRWDTVLGPWAFWTTTALEGVFVVCLAAFSFRFFEAPFLHGYGSPKVQQVTPIAQAKAA